MQNLNIPTTHSKSSGSSTTYLVLPPPILEEEEANVKDSITSRLLSREQTMGEESGGFGCQPVPSTMGQSKVYTLVGDDTKEEEKMAPMAKETKQKWKLLMDPMVENSGRSKNSSTPIVDTMSLVGNMVEMPGITSGSFAPQTIGVGQMKLDATPRYLGKRQLEYG